MSRTQGYNGLGDEGQGDEGYGGENRGNRGRGSNFLGVQADLSQCDEVQSDVVQVDEVQGDNFKVIRVRANSPHCVRAALATVPGLHSEQEGVPDWSLTVFSGHVVHSNILLSLYSPTGQNSERCSMLNAVAG